MRPRRMAEITGQKPVVASRARASRRSAFAKVWTSAAKSRSAALGCTSSSIGLISLALPRVRDFRGLNPDALDGHGNYSLGLSEQLVFPELNPDKFTRVQGMNITICSKSQHTMTNRAICSRRSACRSAAKIHKHKQSKQLRSVNQLVSNESNTRTELGGQ